MLNCFVEVVELVRLLLVVLVLIQRRLLDRVLRNRLPVINLIIGFLVASGNSCAKGLLVMVGMQLVLMTTFVVLMLSVPLVLS
ncbi:hypothetical protein C9I86_02460 [Photobacterium sp. NCIMB 13483]|nr:hypothetical protein C9I86_02460 [Photobacterium sp. NCIMB 13483]